MPGKIPGVEAGNVLTPGQKLTILVTRKLGSHIMVWAPWQEGLLNPSYNERMIGNLSNY